MKVNMAKLAFGVSLLAVALTLAACAPQPTELQDNLEQPLGNVDPLGSASAPAEENSAADSESATDTLLGPKLSLPNLCLSVSGEEVATLGGGSLRSEPSSTDYGEEFQGCTYELDTQDGGYDYYIVYAQPASLLLTVFDSQAEALEGLGEQAQLKWEEGEQQYRLAVIQGALGIEVIGEHSEVMIEIARLLLQRLSP